MEKDTPRKLGIVVTTIFDGGFVADYFRHFEKLDQLERVNFYVVGDLSTPASCREIVERYRATGLSWHYFGKEEQEDFLRPFPKLAAEIPWRSDNRRNVGFLAAFRDRCDVVVAIDDDNYPKPQWPFFEGHSTVGRTASLPTAVGHDGWFNLCSMMSVECHAMGGGGSVFARGFPYKRRDAACSKMSETISTGRIAVNAGDPDVDAATRLVTDCATRENFSTDLILAPGTLMPINTQNTGILRDAIPAYYYVKMGHPVGGMKLDRFGDIFSGFFIQKCAQAVGDRIRIGAPVVDHRRSPHNLYKDLWNELAGMVVIDDMLPVLESEMPAAKSYGEAMHNLAAQIEEWAATQNGFLWDDALRGYFGNVAQNMRLWVDACRQLT
jgi:hypothetical protein